MTHIRKTFNYPKPDEYLGQFDEQNLTGTHTYEGPDAMWVFIDKATNKISPTAYMEEEEGLEFAEPINLRKVFVDCEENPIICSLMEADVEEDEHELIEETLPNGITYWTYADPPPDHTYEKFDIECNESGVFQKITSPNTGRQHYPWKQPHIKWAHLRRHRQSLLQWSDDKVNADMPESLQTQWNAYRQTLRDLPVIYGDSFDVEITTAGTGYEVGDKIKFAASNFEDFLIADELVATVKTVNGTGGITTLTLSGNQAINDGNDIVIGRAAKDFPGMVYTYEAVTDGADAGADAVFRVHKCQRYAAWKIDTPRSPCGTA